MLAFASASSEPYFPQVRVALPQAPNRVGAEILLHEIVLDPGLGSGYQDFTNRQVAVSELAECIVWDGRDVVMDARTGSSIF